MKKGIAIIVVIILALSIVGCSGNKTSSGSSGGSSSDGKLLDGMTVGFVSIDDAIQHCMIMRAAVQEMVEANGGSFMASDGRLDIAVQNKGVEDFIAAGVDAIILEGLDGDAHKGVLMQAAAEGILVVQNDVVNTEGGLDGIVLGQTTSDNYLAGVLNGQDAIKRIKDTKGLEPKDAVCVLLSAWNSNTGIARGGGFKETWEAAGGTIAADPRAIGHEEGLSVTDDLIQAYDFDVLFGQHDPCAFGAAAAVKTAGYKPNEVLIYGVDGNQENLQQIKEGWIHGTAMQDPAAMGRISVDFILKTLKGEEFETFVTVPVFFINIDNVDEYLE